ncbi:MAG: TetR/AcrR family transcriptional regulator [Candidatus Thorarchaeota archaeon]
MSSEESTKKQILESAYHLFIERGFSGSSMRDIAKNAGIKAASIYNHFENKDQIFEAVFIERHPLFRILEILGGISGNSAEELLTNAANRLFKELREDSKLLNLFFVEIVEMNGKHVEKAINTNFPEDSDFIRQIYKLKSEVRNIPIPVMIRSLIGAVFANVVFSWFVGKGNLKRWGTQSQMVDVLLRGILEKQELPHS